MSTKLQREIVIEFEKVQTIRKRTTTTLAFCVGCGGEADFVGLRTAADLFGTDVTDLASFVAANAVHQAADIDICIPSLLVVMQARNSKTIKLIGE